jgi:hypothetical protein
MTLIKSMPELGLCEADAPYPGAHRCTAAARYVVDGRRLCGIHRRSAELRRTSAWRVRVLDNAQAGRGMSFQAWELAELAAMLRERFQLPVTALAWREIEDARQSVRVFRDVLDQLEERLRTLPVGEAPDHG